MSSPIPAPVPDPPVLDLGETTSIEIIRTRIPLAGRRVMDVGCGAMAFSRQLTEAGARVLAIDPDPVQAAANRAAGPEPGIEFLEADATRLPADDASMDAVFFSFSLHHVPESDHPAALAEVRRVLAPDGTLCVIEPDGGPLNDVMRLFHDEDAVRAAAQRSLRRLARPMFDQAEEFLYHSPISYGDFDGYVASHAGRSFNPRSTDADIRRPEVREAFERLAGPGGSFRSPKRMMLLRGPRRSDRPPAAGRRLPPDPA